MQGQDAGGGGAQKLHQGPRANVQFAVGLQAGMHATLAELLWIITP